MGEKYQCILTDAENGKVLDILPSRTGWRLAQYLRSKERQDTNYVVSDLAKDFIRVLSDIFPGSKHCADKYHVTDWLFGLWNRCVKKFKRTLEKDYRQYSKRSRSLLLRPYDSLNDEEKQQLNIMLYASAEIASAHFLKEQFVILKKATTA